MSVDRRVGEELAALVRRMVEYPRAVDLEVFPERSRTVFELGLARDDLGKVIGRQGRTARALRTLLDARGDREGRRYGLEIFED